MTTTYTKNIESQTYRDDYDPDKGFHKVLFTSGKALQSRELNQLQTIIQEEMKRLGDNIFKEGAALQAAVLNLDSKFRFIKLNTDPSDASNPGIALPATSSTLKNKVFVGQTSGVSVRVIDVVEAVGSDPATIYVQYVNTKSATASAAPISVKPNEELLEKDGAVVLIVQNTNTVSNPAVGMGVRVSTEASDFYAADHFVRAPAQSLIVSKYDPAPTLTLGFKLTQEIVGPSDDDTLYDNQGALPNYTAPGADRLKISLVLTDQANVTGDDVFVYYARIEKGILTDSVTGMDDYNKITDAQARRTFEESGNYAIKPFRSEITNHTTDTTKFVLKVSTGTAYISGYRVDKKKPETIDMPKSTATSIVENQGIAANYGNYIKVKLSTLKSLPDVSNFEELKISNAADAASATFAGAEIVGTLRVRAIERDTPTLRADVGAIIENYRFYVFDIKMNAGKTFARDAKFIGLPTDGATGRVTSGELVQTNAVNQVYDALQKELLFKIPGDRPKTVSDISFAKGKRYTGVSDGTNVTITASSGEQFINLNEWLISSKDGSVIDPQGIVSVSAGTGTITATGSAAGDAYQVYAYTRKAIGTVATKSSVSRTSTIQLINGIGDLGFADVHEVTAIRVGGSTGSVVTEKFNVDTGQRDGYYAHGRVLLKAGRSLGTSTTVHVSFKYFSHTAGDFFGPNSYTNVTYDKIPKYTKENGQTVDLANFLDFRSVKDGDGEFNQIDSLKFHPPKNGAFVTADVTYFTGRVDILTIDDAGAFRLISGTPGFKPKIPDIPANQMGIYRYFLNPGSLSPRDVTSSKIENKRYTMRDISKIEKKLESLEEFTTLSLLELDTQSIPVLDAENRDRTKSGYFADNFADQFFSHVQHPEYRAANDPRNKLIRAQSKTNNIGLFYDSDLSTKTILKGDTIYVTHGEENLLSQTLASNSVNCNPFLNMSFFGDMSLSPSSDEWFDIEYTAERLIDGGSVLNTDLATQWDMHEWNWGGIPIDDLEVGAAMAVDTEISHTNWKKTKRLNPLFTKSTYGTDVVTETVVNRIVSSETIREVIGDRVIDVGLLPFMRSQLVSFKAEGLKPNVELFAYFDGEKVDDWVRAESLQSYNVNKQTDFGNLYNDATQHISGKTKLFTDGKGSITGTFFIPSTFTEGTDGAADTGRRFRTGEKEFALLDVTEYAPDNAVSIAAAFFVSTGTLTIRQEDVQATRMLHVVGESSRETTTRNVRSRRNFSVGGAALAILGAVAAVTLGTPYIYFDPVAQSFLTNTTPKGTYLTGVGLFFKTKDLGINGADPLPILVQIRTMENGIPTNVGVPGAHKLIPASDVVTSTDATGETKVTFDEPVFLNGNTEYSIVLLTLSDQYEIYVSTLGEFELGSTTKRIQTQPYLGSFFKSQNSLTWTPDQLSDMTFKLYRASFDTGTASAVLKNVPVPKKRLAYDPVEFFYGDSSSPKDVKIRMPGHGLFTGDTVSITGLVGHPGGTTKDSTFNAATHTITNADHTGFTITDNSLTDSNTPNPFTPTITGAGEVQVTNAYSYHHLWPTLETIAPPDTTITYSVKTTSGKSYAGSETPNVIDTSFSPVAMKQTNTFDTMRRVTPSATMATSLIIKADLTTQDSSVAPVVDLQRASATLVNNIIDNPHHLGSVTTHNKPIEWPHPLDSDNFNPALYYNGTTVVSGTYDTRLAERFDGAAAAKHITTPVRLIASAVGLKILMGANRPTSTFIDMYTKTALDEDLSDVEWVFVEPETPVGTDDDGTYREYRYLTGNIDGTSAEFTKFQLKIVMRSSDQTKSPLLKDLRVIAIGD